MTSIRPEPVVRPGDLEDGAPAPPAEAPGQAGRSPALVTSQTEFPKKLDDSQIQARRARYSRRAQSSKWIVEDACDEYDEAMYRKELGGYVDSDTGEIYEKRPFVLPIRPARCSWRTAWTVGVHAGNNHAHYSGTTRCASVWACPVCAAVIRAERAREIAKAVEQHQAAGGGVVFVTLTLRHRLRQPLAETLDTVLSGWQKLIQGRGYAGETAREYEARELLYERRSIQHALDPDRARKPRPFAPKKRGLKGRYGIRGFIRSVEVTWGYEFGWHPHVHALLFTGQELTLEEADRLGDDVHKFWAKYARDRTGLTPTRTRGVDVQRVDHDGKVIGQYLGKVQDEGKKWGVGAELARADVKTARGGGQSFVPFEMLDDETDLDEKRRRRLWLEFVGDTRGRRAITWSHGLKERFELEEREDDEIIEDAHKETLRWVVPGRTYDGVRRRDPVKLAYVLESAEKNDWDNVGKILPGRRIEADDEADSTAEEPPPKTA